jgi:hypothetical protein
LHQNVANVVEIAVTMRKSHNPLYCGHNGFKLQFTTANVAAIYIEDFEVTATAISTTSTAFYYNRKVHKIIASTI